MHEAGFIHKQRKAHIKLVLDLEGNMRLKAGILVPLSPVSAGFREGESLWLVSIADLIDHPVRIFNRSRVTGSTRAVGYLQKVDSE